MMTVSGLPVGRNAFAFRWITLSKQPFSADEVGMPDQCLSPKEVATLLGVSERTATRLLCSGAVEAFKVRGKLWRTTAAKVAAYQQREFARYRIGNAA